MPSELAKIANPYVCPSKEELQRQVDDGQISAELYMQIYQYCYGFASLPPGP